MHGSIHIKLDYDEAVNLKRNMLLIEKDLLESVKLIRNYDSLRKKEFAIKNKVKKELEEIHALISSVENDLPKEEAEFEPKKYTLEIEEEKEIRRAKSRTVEKKKNDIERQIDEIRAKLSALGA